MPTNLWPRLPELKALRGGVANPDETRELIKFNDYLGLNELYKPWKPFKHPTYGDIEIGGWVKMSSRLPHPFMLQELVHRNAMVVLYAAEQNSRGQHGGVRSERDRQKPASGEGAVEKRQRAALYVEQSHQRQNLSARYAQSIWGQSGCLG